MSAATGSAITHGAQRRATWPAPEPVRVKLLEWGLFLLVAGFLIALAPTAFHSMNSEVLSLVPWLIAVALTDLLPVQLFGTTLALSLPILLAAGMVFPPVVAGTLALVGTSDLRELRREISVGRSLYNRSQIALCVIVASWLFHSLGGDLNNWPSVIFIGLATLIADWGVNLTMLSLGWWAADMGGVREAARRVMGNEPLSFMMTYVCFGLAAVLLAVVYGVAGAWGLLAFVIPVLLGQRVFSQSAQLRDMSEKVSEKTHALRTVSEKMAEERRDERLTVAAGLHDDLLPPLYKVHLMGQVLRQDLAMGRLLNLEDDLPELLGATEEASNATQTFIRDLRRSSLGAGGLVGTLQLLVRDLLSSSICQIRLEAEEVGGSPLVQLLAYQVAREALRNAVQHAHASQIFISLTRDGSDMRLVVEDDGDGFDPQGVDREKHFGLQLMKERIELAGGLIHLHTAIGEGTGIVIRLPAETSSNAS